MPQLNIDPESLKPKLPSRKDLKPYPVTCYLEYRGHEGAVVSISTEASGQWIASGAFILYVLLSLNFMTFRLTQSHSHLLLWQMKVLLMELFAFGRLKLADVVGCGL